MRNIMEVIYIMMIRQIKLFYRSKPRMISSIAQPTLFLIALGLGFGPVFEQAGDIDYIQYLTPGIIGMTLLFGSMMNGMSIIWDKEFGFLKETLVAPVPRPSLLIGRCLGGAITSMLQGLIVFGLSYLIMGFRLNSIVALPLFLVVMLLIALSFTLLGTVIATKVDDMQAFPTVMNFLIFPMFFLSGAIFPIENLPNYVATITNLNPMTYGVNLLRNTINLDYTTANFLDTMVILALIILLIMIGSPIFNRIET
ncbi:ABC transporter permease [Natranaerobius thermophilus]|uniref:Transport permease protein n=1 Tax=Natranaerobius thermophilus (strain ATCC BAA-1301 / DSM 18059 / JW/NM-WN-LF) TaxID=457570 RepID=B2A8C5_NATTJ|nr:ABC transporter permease [Natranaerobius thermophilus]ACB84491.1 ABC-2 type transporter [Natranaerobius thermophilus JW/NM-WN-LF]